MVFNSEMQKLKVGVLISENSFSWVRAIFNNKLIQSATMFRRIFAAYIHSDHVFSIGLKLNVSVYKYSKKLNDFNKYFYEVVNIISTISISLN